MKCQGVHCRTVLWYLVFFGCGVNYMIRSNINIAIVAMVISEHRDEANILHSECMTAQLSTNYSVNISEVMVNKTQSESQFNWNEHEQSHVLGAFFWSYWMSQVVGGTLTKRYGTKAVFGLSNLTVCILTYFIPLFSKWNLWALVVLRIIQGGVAGVCWPSLHDMVARWIPPNERSKFMSAYTGSSMGAAVTYPLCGFIIHFLGWEAVFYVTASLGVTWFCVWWLLVYDTPAAHPRISQKELSYIHHSLGGTLSNKKLATPWWRILTSGPMWLTISVSWACLWGMFTLLTQGPTYFQYVHGWGIRMNGFLSGIPHICRILLGIGLALVCDILLERQICSRTTVRKISAVVGCFVQGVFLLGLAFSGCNATLAIICLTVALATTAAEASGPLASYVDLSPNHASVIFGIANTATVIPGFMSPVIVGYLTFQNQTVGQWQIVFFIAAAMTVIPCILYLLIGDSETQSWNYIDDEINEETHNLQKTSLEIKK